MWQTRTVALRLKDILPRVKAGTATTTKLLVPASSTNYTVYEHSKIVDNNNSNNRLSGLSLTLLWIVEVPHICGV